MTGMEPPPPTADRAVQLARQLLAGELTIADFAALVSSPALADVGPAQVDLDRRRRCGFPEVVFGQGKTVEALEKIFHALLAAGENCLATRITPEQAAAVAASFPAARYNPVGRTLRIDAVQPKEDIGGLVAIITAGTSDLPVAEEARETAEWMGVETRLIVDAGVAGPQRLQRCLPELREADCIVVVAGMEGALPSVVGGYVACPVVAVPTSVGYGASFGGVAALLGMLNSCAANVTVVNIDAGFKGGYIAAMIARAVHQAATGKRDG
jgi:NCAIR mutase (PurE)-related protein